MKEGCYEYIQAPGLPPLEDLVVFLVESGRISVYIGVSCAIGRGLADEQKNPTVKFAYGQFADASKLADLIIQADHIIGF